MRTAFGWYKDRSRHESRFSVDYSHKCCSRAFFHGKRNGFDLSPFILEQGSNETELNQKNDDEDDPENNTEPNRTGVNDFGKLTVLEFAKLVMLVGDTKFEKIDE